MRYWRRSHRWILLVGLLAAVALVLAEYQRRQNLYWYDVQQGYSYAFDANLATWTPVQVSPAGFELPAPAAATDTDTVLLELQLEATLTGHWFEPCIEITVGRLTERQCFERGASGQRYVLLPPATSSEQIDMRGHHVVWPGQAARVVRFQAPRLEGARVLVLAPHPDDAEIAAFGLYATQDAYVATVTAGNYVDGLYGRLGLDAQGQDELRGEVRVWDSLSVPQLGGVPQDRTVNLGYLTYSLQAFHDAAAAATGASATPSAVGRYRQGAVATLLGGRPATADWASVVADLAALIEATRPDVIVSPHPGLDDHTDHQYTTVALLEALDTLEDSSTTLLLYTNHHTLAEHYPFGPASALVTLPPWFGAAGAGFGGVLSYRLEPRLQMRKLFALEAMHDLRAPPVRLVEGSPTGVLMQRFRQAADLVRRDPFGDYSYFRRAVRPNELFFVYPPDTRAVIGPAEATAGRGTQ